jgi:flagellar P-ring protein precursor FlgI
MGKLLMKILNTTNFFSFYLFFTLFIFSSQQSFASSKIKDFVSIKGVRENPLIGYGLVIGLNGTGDGGGELSESSLKRMFLKLGLNPTKEFAAKNVATVIVSASLPPFARVGQKLDINVSVIGNSSSLLGGTLLMTPLKGADGQVYAIAGGQISLGGINQGKKFATNGRITSGAIIEKEIKENFNEKNSLRLSLNQNDFTTAHRIQSSINKSLGGKFAFAIDSSTVDIIIPVHYSKKVVELMAIIENIEINPDNKAKIVINERTGTIVLGGDISLNEVAISHGDLSIEVQSQKGGAQNKNAKPQKIFNIESTTSLKDLIKSLNDLGVSPEDLISILSTLKKQGAINGEIEFI